MDRRSQDPGGRCHGSGHRHHQASRYLPLRRHLDRDPRHGGWSDGAAARPACLRPDCRHRGIGVGIAALLGTRAFVALALLFILNQGYWGATLETLSLVMVATFASAAIGVPLGIAAAHRPRLFAAMRPVLDLMQTLPTFVYLIPTLVLFGLGVVPGLISTVIFALPAPIRLTHLGISSVPRPLIEAGEAFGATPMQLLWKVELPSAAGTIIAGITQCIMLSLSMVVIAALVGAGGLGVPVVRALNSVQVGMGFEAGFTIVLLAIILDRISRPKEREVPR